ncbi:MAG: aminoacyl-tRNA hydrolase [Omnitrophica WOR_2 bacterium RBG_13_44_8b]|nr:MAG: aminoacyl-tRNA hydrolase [Omnitrophica WOR_2 bacterium RBG_13_44_8b]
MKLIVGLGNPGLFLANSRHNVGFSVVKALSKIHKAALKKEKGIPALTGKIKIGQQALMLAMPVTFMNLSGSAVAGLVKRHKVDLENLLVVCDDLDLEFSRLKLKPTGSSGGHRGLKSIIEALNTGAFTRLRIGIGRPRLGVNSSDYVLSRFTKQEQKEVKTIIESAAQCCLSWVTQGIEKTMNIFNMQGEK